MLKDLFVNDPVAFEIPNQGVASVNDAHTRALEFELRTFVCEAQYAEGIERILSSYLDCLGTDRDQKAAWVSGFYGSGKSHMVKVLAHLWGDTIVGGSSARQLVDLPDEPKRLLKELSTRGAQFGHLHMVMGTMKEAAGGGQGVDDIRLALLGLVHKSVDLPATYAQSRLCLKLRQLGVLQKVSQSTQEAGPSFEEALNSLYVARELHEAIRTNTDAFGTSTDEIKATLRAQYPRQTTLSQAELIGGIEEALKKNGKLPLTLIVLDELQQFIGESSDRAFDVQDVVEAICKEPRLPNRLLFVATGQSAITETPQLQRLQARFIVRISLSDTDVERVVRKVVLAKKPTSVGDVRKELSDRSGEIDRQLQGTRIAPTADDQSVLVADYPLLPARRRFWERALRALDRSGQQAMLRSQLGLVHKALRGVAERELGGVIPADALYDNERESMIQSGVLSRDIDDLIEKQRQEPGGGLMARICALVFIISKLPREAGSDIGIRADERTLSDLLVDDLRTGYDALYPQVEKALGELVAKGHLAKVENEYRLQTAESAEWNRSLSDGIHKLKNDAPKIASLRTERLTAAVDEALKGFKALQGKTKTPRKLSLHFGATRPPSTDGIPVWVRDGWGESEETVRREAQDAGVDSATLFVFLPNTGDNLKDALAGEKACEELLTSRSSPGTPEGREARRGTESRQRDFAEAAKGELSRVLAGAKVFVGGGSAADGEGLRAAVEAAAGAAMARLYPNFDDADDPKWDTVSKHARAGNEGALEALGYHGAFEDHPVTRRVLQFAGAGKRGGDILSEFEKPPYGWPTESITGALTALLAANKLLARHLDQPIGAKQLDGQKLKSTEFKAEQVPLSANDKIKLRGLFQKLVKVEAGKELEASDHFLRALVTLADASGGDAPAPSAPSTVWIEDLRAAQGNARLAAILQDLETIEVCIKDSKAAKELVEKRQPTWARLQEMLSLAGDLPEAAAIRSQAEAVRKDRLLLDEPDPVRPLADQLEAALRAGLRKAQDACATEYERLLEEMRSSDAWDAVSESDWQRICEENGIHGILPFDAKSDAVGQDGLVASLRKRSLAHWESERLALAGRFARAQAEANKLLAPEAVTVRLPRRLLKSTAEVETYVAALKEELLDRISRGPVQLD
jgi:hypothetical protein